MQRPRVIQHRSLRFYLDPPQSRAAIVPMGNLHRFFRGGFMSFSLQLISQENSGLAIVAAEGEATAHEFPTSNSIHFDNLLGTSWDCAFIALDMDRVNYIDSAAIGWLLSCHKALRAGGGKLALYALQPQVRQILEILRIDRVIPISHNLEAAKTMMLPYRATILAH
jgi:anti-anti-sigma factor